MRKTSLRSWLVPHLLLVVLCLAMFSPWIVSGKVLAPFDIVQEILLPWRADIQVPDVKNHFVSDAVTQYLPYRLFAEQSFREDGYIGWNPMIFGGTPQYANTMGLYFDWTIQLHRFLSFWNAWHGGLILQFILAGTGMFLFLRSCGISSPIALIGALAYMTNWQFTAWVYHRWALGSFCWFPWILFSMSPWISRSYKANKKNSRDFLRFAMVPLFLTLAFLGGSLQYSAYIVIGVGCLFLGHWIDKSRNESFKVRDFLRSFSTFLIWGLLAVGLAGAMFDATIRAFFENNATGHVRGGLGYAFGAGQPLWNALSYPFYLFPFLLGSPQSLDGWKVFHSDLFNIGFFGTIPMLLALLAFFHKGVPTGAKILMLAGLLIPLTPLVGPLYHRINLLWILGGSWAACAFLQGLSQVELLSISRKFIRLCVFVLGFWLVCAAFLSSIFPHALNLLTAEVLGISQLSQFGYFKEWLSIRADRAIEWFLPSNPIQLFSFLFALLAAWGLRWLTRSRGALPLVAGLAVFLQTTLFWWVWTTWSDPKPGYDLPAAASVVHMLQNHPRLTQEIDEMPLTPFPQNTLSVFGIPVTGGYDSIHPLRMESPNTNTWSFPGTAYYLAMVGSAGPPGWKSHGQELGGELYENPSPEPIYSALINRQGEDSSEPAHITLEPTQKTLNKRIFDIPPVTSEVRILENWNAGWKFRLGEGQWQDVTAASNRSMTIPMPSQASPTKLTMQFFPFPSPLGLIISFVSAIILICIMGRGVCQRFSERSS